MDISTSTGAENFQPIPRLSCLLWVMLPLITF